MFNFFNFGHFYFKKQNELLILGIAKQLGVLNFEKLYELADQSNQMIIIPHVKNEENINKKIVNKVILNVSLLNSIKRVYNLFARIKGNCLSLINIPYARNFIKKLQLLIYLYRQKVNIKEICKYLVENKYLGNWEDFFHKYYFYKFMKKIKSIQFCHRPYSKNVVKKLIKKKKKNKINRLTRLKLIILKNKFLKRRKFIKKFLIYKKLKCHN